MLSAVVLTHNEGKSLIPTLDSLRWCDELIVVDDESSDDTVKISKTYTDTVFSRPLQEDFAAQRNFGLSKTKGDWVLFVDSDEIVSKELRDEIGASITRDDVAGFAVRRSDVFLGKTLRYGETSRVRLVRLAKRQAGKWTRSVHEVWSIQGKTGELHNPLLHDPHSSVSKFLTDIDRYSTINARVFRKQGVPKSAWPILVYPAAKFLRNYFLLEGFRDGTPGAIMAIMMSFHSYLTRAKLYLMA
jgi:glycosyltransferase involved in cell wall biosynthesis